MEYSMYFILKTFALLIAGIWLASLTNEIFSNLYVFAAMMIAFFGLGALILGLVKVSDIQRLISKK
jgi:hypothetical protein